MSSFGEWGNWESWGVEGFDGLVLHATIAYFVLRCSHDKAQSIEYSLEEGETERHTDLEFCLPDPTSTLVHFRLLLSSFFLGGTEEREMAY